jgi:hypothetical protein
VADWGSNYEISCLKKKIQDCIWQRKPGVNSLLCSCNQLINIWFGFQGHSLINIWFDWQGMVWKWQLVGARESVGMWSGNIQYPVLLCPHLPVLASCWEDSCFHAGLVYLFAHTRPVHSECDILCCDVFYILLLRNTSVLCICVCLSLFLYVPLDPPICPCETWADMAYAV